MSQIGFRVRTAILAFGWLLVIASIVGQGFSSDSLWLVGFHFILTISLFVLREPLERPPVKEGVGPATRAWADRLAESKLGKALLLFFALIMMVGQGALIGVLICVPFLGIVEPVAIYPELLASAIAWAAMSMIGFLLLTLALRVFGPVLWVVFEAWIGYIAPVIGGTVGSGLASGWISGTLWIVGTSVLVGGVALLLFEMSASKKRVNIKGVGDTLTAGLGFGLVNGAILAGMWKIWDLLR